MVAIIPLYAAITPFILWPLEQFLPYPYLIEEFAKAIILTPLFKVDSKVTKIKLATICGILFALSESVLFLFNISQVGTINTFLLRLLLTIPLHVFTSVIIILSTFKDKRLIFFGVILASALHFLFNSLIKR